MKNETLIKSLFGVVDQDGVPSDRGIIDKSHPKYKWGDFLDKFDEVKREVLLLNFGLNHVDVVWSNDRMIDNTIYRSTVHKVFKAINELDPEYLVATDIESDHFCMWTSPWSVWVPSTEPDQYIATCIEFMVDSNERQYYPSDDKNQETLKNGIKMFMDVLGYTERDARKELSEGALQNLTAYDDCKKASVLVDLWVESGDFDYLIKAEKIADAFTEAEWEKEAS